MSKPASQKLTSGKVTGTLDKTRQPATDLSELLEEAVIHLNHKRHAQLDQVLAKAAAIDPEDARVLHFQGLSAFGQRRTKKAFEFLRRAINKRPGDPALQHNMAAVLISLGKFKEAEELLQAAIRIKPGYAEAYHTLAPIHTFTAEDPLIPMMAEGLETPGLNQADISFYAFALAQACDEAGLHDRAWPALERANAAMAHTFDPAREDRAVAQLEMVATRDRLEDLGRYGHPTGAPLYVVGLPRSGTTLLESVIAEHPQVFAAGELTALGGIGRSLSRKLGIPQPLQGYGEAIERITPPHAYAAGLGYLNAARTRAVGWFDHFVDKMPDNSFNLGLAAVLTPRARVIHIMRHPLDTMLSIYMQRFTSVRYSFRPRDILHHYHNYQRIMAHWRRHLPLDLIELRYENLVQDVDFARLQLWERLGLTAEVTHVPEIMTTEEQRTASRFQVRQPVYQSSREKFRRYENHMGAFIEGLGGMEAIEAEVAAQEARCALRAAAN